MSKSKKKTDISKELGNLPLDLPDLEIAKGVRNLAKLLAVTKNGALPAASWSAAMLLCLVASETNADTLSIDITGATFKGKSIGSWKITARRFDKKEREG